MGLREHAEAGERAAVLDKIGSCEPEFGSNLKRWTSVEREIGDRVLGMTETQRVG